MGNGITFVHSADLHMDSLFKTKGHLPEELLERLRAGTFEAFDRLIQVCINEQADFLLIAGDVYHEELRSLKAQVHVRRGFEKLQKHDIHVYVSFGNHDFTGGAEHAVSFPENVHVFQSEEVQALPFYKEGERLAHIYGFSYETRAVKDHKAREFQKSGHPLYHIAMLHGSLETNTDHDVYAPFTLEELKNKGMDYWALGHIHKREVLSSDPLIIYPGNTQGRSQKEQGAKGCYVIEEKEGEWKSRFQPLHSFVYESVSYPVPSLENPNDLERVLEDAKRQITENGASVMLSVTLEGSSSQWKRWWSSGVMDEWKDIVNENEDITQEGWVWIEDVRLSEVVSWNEEDLHGPHFTGEFLKKINEADHESVDTWLAPLYGHRKMSRFVPALDEEEQAEVLEKAKTEAVNQLMGSGDDGFDHS
ncbi:metallophosphoesterase family protein [Halobacillus litoralis]|uniref:metallophosphoesterase family protein n=1 Tax=Halobacillus litoralis TaxID=45668 RepID=UPI001CD660A6|nr:DNA repair exonuclease [Halobacillus litoralis]MCA1022587.1 DNA repair exonuclease [Halobacillus litoralis]